jgi:hypothetical protein
MSKSQKNDNVVPIKKAVKNIIETESINNNLLKDQSWDTLSELYTSLNQMLATIGLSVNKVMEEIDVIDYIENKNEFNLLVSGLARDIEQFKNEIDFIASRHKDFSGQVKDQNELMVTFELYADYDTIKTKIINVLNPIHASILMSLREALTNKQSQLEKEQND